MSLKVVDNGIELFFLYYKCYLPDLEGELPDYIPKPGKFSGAK
jgi:hypothetical protein